MENNLISVIVPVYNALPALRGCIESLCAQTYQALEIILVDDGSTDGSGAVCDEFAAKNEKVQVIHTKNGGASAARNTGLSNMRGEFLTFCDADDIVPQDAYQAMMNDLERTNADVVVGGWIEWDGTEEKKITPGEPGIYDAKTVMKGIVGDNYRFGGGFPWNKLWRVSSIKEMALFDPALYVFEDKLWIVQTLKQIKTVAVGNFFCYRYLVQSNSLSHNTDKERKRQRNIDLLSAAYRIYCEVRENDDVANEALYYYGRELVSKSFTLKKEHLYSKEMAEMLRRDDKKLFKRLKSEPRLLVKLSLCRYFWKK